MEKLKRARMQMQETIKKIKQENIKGVYGTLKELFKSKDKHLISTLLQSKQDYIVVENEKVAAEQPLFR